jgi:hypothetical protein
MACRVLPIANALQQTRHSLKHPIGDPQPGIHLIGEDKYLVRIRYNEVMLDINDKPTHFAHWWLFSARAGFWGAITDL